MQSLYDDRTILDHKGFNTIPQRYEQNNLNALTTLQVSNKKNSKTERDDINPITNRCSPKLLSKTIWMLEIFTRQSRNELEEVVKGVLKITTEKFGRYMIVDFWQKRTKFSKQ